jgi:hypothetical protein
MTPPQLTDLAHAVAIHKQTGDNAPLLAWIKTAAVARKMRAAQASGAEVYVHVAERTQSRQDARSPAR